MGALDRAGAAGRVRALGDGARDVRPSRSGGRPDRELADLAARALGRGAADGAGVARSPGSASTRRCAAPARSRTTTSCSSWSRWVWPVSPSTSGSSVRPVLTGLRATRRVVDPAAAGRATRPRRHRRPVRLLPSRSSWRPPARTCWRTSPRSGSCCPPSPRCPGSPRRPRLGPGPGAAYAGRAPRPAVPAVGRVVSGSSTLLAPRRRRALHRVRRAGYRLRPGPRELPTYFIVGAKRAGTTSLDEYIKAHPLVLRGLVEKGCRYYDVNYDRGPRLVPPASCCPSPRSTASSASSGSGPILGRVEPLLRVPPGVRAADRGRRPGRAADLRPPRPGRARLVALPLRGGARLRDPRLRGRRSPPRRTGWPSPTPETRRPPPPPLQLCRPEPVRRAAGPAAGSPSTRSRSS